MSPTTESTRSRRRRRQPPLVPAATLALLLLSLGSLSPGRGIAVADASGLREFYDLRGATSARRLPGIVEDGDTEKIGRRAARRLQEGAPMPPDEMQEEGGGAPPSGPRPDEPPPPAQEFDEEDVMPAAAAEAEEEPAAAAEAEAKPAVEKEPEAVYDGEDAIAPGDAAAEAKPATEKEPMVTYDGEDAVAEIKTEAGGSAEAPGATDAEATSDSPAAEEGAVSWAVSDVEKEAEDLLVKAEEEEEKREEQAKEEEGGMSPPLAKEGEGGAPATAAPEEVQSEEEAEAAAAEAEAEATSAEAEAEEEKEEEETPLLPPTSEMENSPPPVSEAKEEEKEEEQDAPPPAVASMSSRKKTTQLSGSSKVHSAEHRNAWVAHGSVGAVVFGLLVPSAISSALFRDCIPAYWIYVHVSVNVITFAVTFFTVGIAFATMNGMGEAGEGHLKEVHHVVGLLLLMLVSFQTANGFLRPPREFVTDDEYDRTPGAVLRSTLGQRSLTARALWHLVHGATGLIVFGLGAYQVRSGLGLYARRFGTPDWGQVWVGYVGWLSAIVLIAKTWMYCRERRAWKKENLEVQMGRKRQPQMPRYDPENDLTVAQFETV